MFVFHHSKKCHFGFSRFSSSFLVRVRCNRSINLVFRTTGVEDTNLTLAVISFKIGANNSLIFSLLQTYEKKFAEFPFLLSL